MMNLMLKLSLKYSVASGLCLISLFILLKFLGINLFLDVNIILYDIALFGLFISFACWEFKNQRNNGILHFWQGMTIGFFVYSISIFVFMIFLITYVLFDDQYLTDYINQASSYYQSRKDEFVEYFGEEKYNAAQSQVSHANIYQLMTTAFLKKIGAALLTTPVVSIILRKKAG